jgi:peptidoglycan/xylan/chitin deacetylase (PgdA/CDA1 family)
MQLTRASWICTVVAITAISAAPLALVADGSAGASDSQRRSTGVPILMYHELGAPPAGAPYPELYVREADFRAQIRWLRGHGYRAVTLRAVWEHWHGGRRLPRRPVVISFDDGFRSTASVALPALGAQRWPAVLNLALHHLDVRWGLWSRDVRAMLASGWELASHTLTHPDLTGVGDAQLDREIAGSRRVLARRFNVPVDFFCYPAGRYDARVAARVEQAGYLGATTTLEGLAHPDEAYALRRVRVSRSDGVAGLASSLADLQPG